jgi:hypothetical protein
VYNNAAKIYISAMLHNTGISEFDVGAAPIIIA